MIHSRSREPSGTFACFTVVVVVVEWVELRETHDECLEMVGLVKLDPPYVPNNVFCPTKGTFADECYV
jgi:hypothetical protein